MKLKLKPVNYISPALILAVLLLVFFLNLKQKSKPIELLPLVQEEEITAQDIPQLKGVEISLVDQTNRLNWRLTVEKMIEEADYHRLFGIKGTYYTAQGEQYLIEAPTGKMGKDFNWLQLEPEVTLTGEDLTLQADELGWDARAGEEITGKNLAVEKENFTVYATEFRFKPEKGDLVVPGESRWTFK